MLISIVTDSEIQVISRESFVFQKPSLIICSEPSLKQISMLIMKMRIIF